MFNYTSLLAKASGVNWYLLLAKVAICLGVMFGCYSYGKHGAQLKCEQAKTAEAKQELIDFRDVISESVTSQSEEATKADAKNVEESKEIDTTVAELKAEIARIERKQAVCNMSDAEFRKFNELAKKTRGYK